jgi:hypothetical protein
MSFQPRAYFPPNEPRSYSLPFLLIDLVKGALCNIIHEASDVSFGRASVIETGREAGETQFNLRRELGWRFSGLWILCYLAGYGHEYGGSRYWNRGVGGI